MTRIVEVLKRAKNNGLQYTQYPIFVAKVVGRYFDKN